MKIGVFGGTFNPVHYGHINLVNAFCDTLQLSYVLCIPTNIPPHKICTDLASGDDRLNMLNLAFKTNKKVKICDIELKLKGKSYTYNTLMNLKITHPDDEFFLLMGSDMFLSLDGWFKFDELISLCTICTIAREKGDYELLTNKSHQYIVQGAKCIITKTDEYILSSSEVRKSLKKGDSIANYLPPPVLQYINDHHLYNGS